MDFNFDESSFNETIDAFLNAVGTSDLSMMDALPLLDLLDDTSDASADGDDDNEDKGGSEEGMNVIPYTDSDDEEMDFKFGRCRGDCLSHLEELYLTSSSRALIGDPKLSSVGSSLRSDNPLTMDYDEEEVDPHQAQLKASREMFAEWRDLEDKELDEYFKNRRKVREQKKVAQIAKDNSDVDIEGITDGSSDSGSDVDSEKVNPRQFTEIRADTNQRSAGSNVLGNSIITHNFHNYAMCPESQFTLTGKPQVPSTSSFKTPQAPSTSSCRTPQAPSTSSFMTSSPRPSTSSFNTSSTSTQVPHAPVRRGRPSTAGGAARRGRPSMAGGAARRGRPSTTGDAAQRGRPPLASSAGRRRSAQLVAAAIRRPVVVTEGVRNVADGAVRRQDRLNEMERSRRRKLSDLLEELRRNVPDTAILDRASKAVILNSAIAYIKGLCVREKEQKFEISTEMNRQKELLRELNKLKRLK